MNFGAVIVTYNRIEHLRKTIKLYSEQTVVPKRIVVVDNHSTDGTPDFLKIWLSEAEAGILKEVIYLQENIGGSGGFYTGLKQMQDHDDIDWIWVADDDAYPELDAFEKAESFISEHQSEINDIAAICGACGSDGKYSGIQRFRYKKTLLGIHDMPIPLKWYDKGTFDIDMYSFVGTLLKRENLLKAGLPRKDFFIYQDDLEHSTRMRKTGRIVCTTSIQITHKDNINKTKETTWRDYYASRNIIALYKEHFSKWSLFWRIFRRKLFALSTFRWSYIRLVNEAIKDGLKGSMGIHPVYKPGWKIDNLGDD